MMPSGNRPQQHLMSASTANAIMLQQQAQQQRRVHPGFRGAHGHHHPGISQNLPTVIPHNSANVESEVLCAYSQYLCTREKVQGFEFCSRHVLEDKNSPYGPCNFQYARIHPVRKCPRPAPKTDRKDGFCAEHARKALVARQKSQRKRPYPDPIHRHLDDLAQYKSTSLAPEIKSEKPSTSQTPTPSSGDFEDLEKEISPFKIAPKIQPEPEPEPQIQPTKLPSPNVQKQFDFGSEDDSDSNSLTVENTWRGDADSDDDSVDSEMENPLKHAGAYSAEEVIRIMRDKLIRLQKLYIDQFQRLQYLLKEERRQYRLALRKEQEAELMSIHRQPKETTEDKVAYDKLKALNHYNKPAGVESVLHAKLMERRIRTSESNSSLMSTAVPGSLAGKLTVPASPVTAKCSYNITTSTRCGDICIPMTKFCQKHILHDPNQVLFRQCNFVVASEDEHHTDDGPCETPIPDIFDTHTCVYHTQFAQPFPTSLIELDAIKRQQIQEQQKASLENVGNLLVGEASNSDPSTSIMGTTASTMTSSLTSSS